MADPDRVANLMERDGIKVDASVGRTEFVECPQVSASSKRTWAWVNSPSLKNRVDAVPSVPLAPSMLAAKTDVHTRRRDLNKIVSATASQASNAALVDVAKSPVSTPGSRRAGRKKVRVRQAPGDGAPGGAVGSAPFHVVEDETLFSRREQFDKHPQVRTSHPPDSIQPRDQQNMSEIRLRVGLEIQASKSKVIH